MEKVIYALWRDPRIAQEDWCSQLRGAVADKLVSLGARGVQVNVCDAPAAPGEQYRQGRQPRIEGVILLWLDSANDQPRKPFDAAIEVVCWRMAAYLVSESHVLINDRHPPQVGKRTKCLAQVALFACRKDVPRDNWIDIWRNSHSQVAIDTQDTFHYTQNLVVRALTFGAPPYEAIVEEGFPEEALTSVHAFYDAVGDDAKLAENQRLMMESCTRFIDFNTIDVVPTSQYLIKPI
ncbi:MAG: EthD domain-containing protein [Proteobacteria bacterium]|nr:EthD domain-containing protein [Pseudomonadota bacterium]HQR04263.1 EthD domain-containing protein [Rhodocyclaceae bacterium]